MLGFGALGQFALGQCSLPDGSGPGHSGPVFGAPAEPLGQRRKKRWKREYPPLREEIERAFRRAKGEIVEEALAPEPTPSAPVVAAEHAIAMLAPYLVENDVNWEALMNQSARELQRIERAFIAYERARQQEAEDEDDLLLLSA